MVIAASALRAHAEWVLRGATGDGRLTLRGEDVRGQDLRSALLSGAVLEGCNLEAALLGGTTWASASVTRTSFRDAVFADARLDDARFVDCDFRDADFSDLDVRARGTTARCRFEQCDLRGSIWLERSVAGACFVDCQFDLVVGSPRDLSNVEIDRPRLSTPEGTFREATAAEVRAFWQSGKLLPHLTDEDKAYVRRGLQGRWRKREAHLARGPRPPAATGIGSIADKWSEPFLPTVASSPPAAVRPDVGEPVELPAGTPAGVSARRGPAGVTIYRDARSGFGVVLPPPVFLPPSDHRDATAGIATAAILHIRYLPRAPGSVAPADEVASLVHDLTGQTPEPLELIEPGIAAAAIATARNDELVRETAAIVGGDGARSGVMVLALDFSTDEIDAMTSLTLWSAILCSAWFGPDLARVPDLVPSSVWWEPGLPLKLAASRPALPPLAGIRSLAIRIASETQLLPPTAHVHDTPRADLARRMAGAGIANALHVAGTLKTIHDVRGLAAALVAAEVDAPPPHEATSPASHADTTRHNLGLASAPDVSASAPAANGSAAAREAAIAARVRAGAASAAAALAATSPPNARASSPIAWAPQPLPLPPPPTIPIPTRPADPSSPILAAHRVVTITAAESAAGQLPAVGMTVDFGGTLLMERVRTKDGRYLMAGGPPGGALGFEVWASDEAATDHAAVQRAAAAHYRMPDLRWGPAGTLTIAGASRPALTFVSGQGAYATHWCAVLVPHARGAVLVAVSLGHLGDAPVSCERVVSYPDLAQAVKTFTLSD
jgi:uncharacterized protein YjbI with pentapeptide repeats